MWVVIYIAKTKAQILKIGDLLCAAGLSARIRPIGRDREDGYFAVLVPETELRVAHARLIQQGF